MEFLGVGPLELLFIFLIALIVLGPKDIVKTGRTLGRFLNRVVKSPTWQAIKQTSREMRYLPAKLMRETGVEEEMREFKDINREVQELKRFSSASLIEAETTNEDLSKSDAEQSKPTTKPPEISPMSGIAEAALPPVKKRKKTIQPINSEASDTDSIKPEHS